jgi:hypothetical protein
MGDPVNNPTMTAVAHPLWAAWRIDLQRGYGLVVGWVRDTSEPWQWHPVVAGAGRGTESAGTPSTYPRELRRALETRAGGILMAVVVELHLDEQTARTRAKQLHREYALELTRQDDAEDRTEYGRTQHQ